MDLNRLTRDADDLIRKVVSRYNQLYVPAGSISQVELDLLLDDLRKLYDTFKTIGQVNLTLQPRPAQPEVTVFSPSVANVQAQSISREPVNQTSVKQEPELQKEEQPTVSPEPVEQSQYNSEAEAVLPIEPEETLLLTGDNSVTLPEEADSDTITNSTTTAAANPVQSVNESETPEKKQPQMVSEVVKEMEAIQDQPPAMLADKYSHVNKSLSDTMLSSNSNDVVGARLNFQPITDLNTGIGLNDKFNFISELFANNPAQYEEAISRINKAVNNDEANWILQKYHTSDWDQKQEALARMKDFIKRRFI